MPSGSSTLDSRRTDHVLRAVVWEVPDCDALTASVRRFGVSDPLECVDIVAPALTSGTTGAISTAAFPVLLVRGVPSEPDQAAGLLRGVVHPLVAHDAFVVGFEADRSAFAPASLELEERWKLDREDALTLLEQDAFSTSFELFTPELFESRTPLTPIEEQLSDAFARAGVPARPQVRFGPFVVDFLIERRGTKLAVEADGAAFHDPQADAQRDRQLKNGLGLTKVIRFTGSEIFRNADRCVGQVQRYLEGSNGSRPRIRRQPLDDSQKAAVEHRGGPARVLAPAGAGKTRVLVERIVELVERGVDPSTILALAFNKKAEEQMKARLTNDARIAVAGSRLYADEDGVRVATFNAFGKRTLDELFDWRREPQQGQARLREAMGRALDRARVRRHGLVRGADPLREFLRARERVVADLRPASDELVDLTYVKSEPIAVPFAEINTDYERELERLGICSFDDQVADAVRALLHSPAERSRVQRRFTHVLVDEFQDLNAAQLALVDVLCRPYGDLFVVGDDDQMIYGWRYAKLTSILDFEGRHPDSSTFVLSTNYRSVRSIVEASERLIGHNQDRAPKKISARLEAPEGAVRYVVADRGERLHALVEFVRDAHETSGQWRKVAVLCRYRSQQLEVAMALDRASIPRTELLSYRLFSHPAAELLRAYLALVLAPGQIDGESLARVINRPNRFATNELIGRLRSSRAPWAELNHAVSTADEAFRARSLRGFIDRTESLHQRLRATKPAPRDVLDEIVREFALEDHWCDAGSNRRSADDADPLAVVRVLQLHAEEVSTSTEFVAYWDRESEREKADPARGDSLAREQSSEDRVVISTIHAAKGREYDGVVLHDFDVALAGLTPHEIEEERRVFYVGMTRAEQRLLITANDGRPLHRFVAESIRPAEGAEETRLGVEKATLRDSRSRLLAEAAEIEEATRRYESGAERARQTEVLRSLEVDESGSTERIEQLERWVQRSSAVDGILGRRRKARTELEVLRGELETTRERTRDQRELVGRITHDPAAFIDSLREQAAQASERVSQVNQHLAAIAWREEELRILT